MAAVGCGRREARRNGTGCQQGNARTRFRARRTRTTDRRFDLADDSCSRRVVALAHAGLVSVTLPDRARAARVRHREVVFSAAVRAIVRSGQRKQLILFTFGPRVGLSVDPPRYTAADSAGSVRATAAVRRSDGKASSRIAAAASVDDDEQPGTAAAAAAALSLPVVSVCLLFVAFLLG